ncbi:YhhN-like protein [Branchiibius hedensis]|uniref:YhhN-like protein n=1 Tax=Branchiibius hedensis TaxID=672460 RepID=A0A2Y9C134_9MICO|nr:lysoplasmalogenase [Branchiibius hedensis]PWJ24776.1 YhhN-like protein [Branchiibius hedensis]SSA33593.1 YhhN-like protein [Branchiibius hedensis]
MSSWPRLRSAVVARVRQRPELVVYVPLAVATAAAGALGRRPLLVVAKSALVPTLQAGAWLRGSRDPILFGATSAGWLGDVILLPRPHTQPADAERRQLRCGAIAFGLQQIGYVTLMARAGVRPRPRRVVAVLPWLGGLSVLDTVTGAGSAPDAIITAYGVLLGGMAIMAWSSPSTAMQTGGVLFLASDSMILIREKVLSATMARAATEAFVLGTYAAAQALLIRALETPGDRPGPTG